MKINLLILCALTLFTSHSAMAVTQQENLFNLVSSGKKCESTQGNGLYCEYKIGDRLSFGIKDVGGTDTVIGFHESDIKNKFYAVVYFGCIVVVPGKAHKRNYDLSYGVYVSPIDGNVYKTKEECKMAANNSFKADK